MNDRLKLQNLKIMAEQLGNLLPVIRNQVQETIKDPKALGEMLSEKKSLAWKAGVKYCVIF